MRSLLQVPVAKSFLLERQISRETKTAQMTVREQLIDRGNDIETAHNPGLSVCMLVTDIDSPTGGVQTQSRRLLRQLGRCGIETYVCTRNYHHLCRTEAQDGAFVRRSPVLNRSLHVPNSAFYVIDALAWLIRNRKRYDVVHCQQTSGAAMVGILAKSLLHKPVIVRVTSTGDSGELSQIHRMALTRFRLRQLRNVDRWVALTPEMKEEICALDVPPERIIIIPNSTDLSVELAYDAGVRERSRALLGITAPQVAVFSGRLSREKGLDVLLHAWKTIEPRYPNAQLILLGEGGAFRNVESELRSLSVRLGLQSLVRFMGHVPNVGDYLLACDLFVLPTRAEGMSNALIEAMATGAAIVTTDIPANRRVVEDQINALLVHPDSTEELASAIVRVLDSPQLAERLGRAARRRAEESFSIETMTAQYLKLYSELVSKDRAE